jgi:hypothetical protein
MRDRAGLSPVAIDYRPVGACFLGAWSRGYHPWLVTAAPIGGSLVAGFADRRAARLTKYAGNANGVTVNSQGCNLWTKRDETP